jgi:cob(I)alamin adenosyltransferase
MVFMGIYTRGGDGGETGLFGGERVSKANSRIGAYGEVDELNSVLGWCAAAANEQDAACLHTVQSLLFSLGSWLATPPNASEAARFMLPAWPEQVLATLESQIDSWEEKTGALTAFILPGGCELAARLQIARTVCRRAERVLAEFALDPQAAVDSQHLAFLNRLSDWLFAFARAANHEAGSEETPWVAPT